MKNEGEKMKEQKNIFDNKEKLAENKVIILYVMQKVNCALTNSQILKILYDFEGFNYYYFQHILSDLVEQKYIINYKQEEEWLYQITAEGVNILELTHNIIPGITKYRLDNTIKSLIKDIANEVTVSAEYIPESNNFYTTKCKITEAHRTLFEINVFCSSHEEAKKIAENWKNNAGELYPEIMSLISKKDSH